MATTKKGKKPVHHHRKKRIGGINGKSVGMRILGIAGSAFADNLARKNFTSLSPLILGVIEVGAGIFIPKFVKGDLGQGVGDGLIAVGTIALLKNFNVISGIGAVTIRPDQRVPIRNLSGYQASAPAIGAAGKAYLTDTVGSMPSMEQQMMGALLYDE